MIIEKIGTGESVEKARENAIALLGAPADADVRIEVVEMPKKKVLGIFGGGLAKVKASYEAPDEAPVKQEKAEKPVPAVKSQPAPKEKVEKSQPEKKAEAPVVEDKVEEKAETPASGKVEIDVASSPVLQYAADYIKKIVLGMGASVCTITAYDVGDNEVVLELDVGEDDGIVIGKWGDTLDSIQYLTRLSANKLKKEGEIYPRISVNVGNYRQKRNKYLVELAQKKAVNVRKYGRNYTFEPMNPYERRVVHTAVQEFEGVTSFSIGEDENRRVVLALEDGFKPLKRDSRGGNRNGGRGNRSSKPAASRPASTRPPKTDEGAKSVGLYGKIN